MTIDVGPKKVSRIAGTIIDPSGAAIADATVKLIDSNGKEWLRNTSTSGQFKFDGFSNGTYKFEVSSLGFNTMVGTVVLHRKYFWRRSLTFKMIVAT